MKNSSISNLKETINKLNESIAEKNRIVEADEKETAAKLESLTAESNKQKETLQASIESLQSQLEAKIAHIEQAAAAQTAVKDSLEAAIETLKQEHKSELTEYEQVHKQSLQDEIESLKKKFEADMAEQGESKMDAIAAKEELFAAEKQSLADANSKLSAQIEQLNAQIQLLTAESEKIRSDTENSHKETLLAKSQLNELTTEKELLENKLTESIVQMENFKNNCSDNEKTQAEFVAKEAALTSQIAQLTDSVTTVNKELDSCRTQLNALIKDNEILVDEKQQLKTKLDTLEALHTSLTGNLEKLDAENKTLNAKIDSLVNDNSNMELINTYKSELEEAGKKINSLEEK